MFQRILLASDGSEHALRAADKAIELIEGNKGTIDVIYVIDGATSKSDVLYYGNKEEIAKKRRKKMKGIEEKLFKNKIEYNVHILQGEPGPTIVKFANERDYDCVVIGSRGLNQFQSLVLGSVSHKVAKRVKCPVMIIK
ncbi:universal stress protein [Halalkalibacterium ligniniphilum]|uniref:universal stress protein n=1 Tax=Halalkalibacterium ligniniphilum TaxID=1134413 RepID=UPI00034868BB|nr:universal stress protein [Halalkalibacterium ligniniphilum]